jgi:GntR family histidine utilization transcriptional repressor
MSDDAAPPPDAVTGADRTLHQRILSDIETRIVSGEWPPGHRLPFEVELARQYGCARMTVNKVMTQLAKAGLVERRRKSGTFVAQPRAQAAILEIHDISREVEQTGLPYSYAIVAHAQHRATAAERARLDLDGSARVLAVTALHRAGPAPFCLEERLINLSAVPEAADADFSATAPGRWLVERVPWSAAEHRIHAASTDTSTAARLAVQPGTACLVVERRTWHNGGPITHATFTYTGERHSLVASFTPAGGG